MMEIKDIEKLAELAKIELNKEEKEGLLKDIESILNYVKQISEVEVPEILPNYENKNRWREDIPEDRVFSADLIKEQFPDSQNGFVKVKKIL
jgi:aspartyl-tRNA(Asn)/glutamyl-tRNA(Gln) amidotransferase subunit C